MQQAPSRHTPPGGLRLVSSLISLHRRPSVLRVTLLTSSAPTQPFALLNHGPHNSAFLQVMYSFV